MKILTMILSTSVLAFTSLHLTACSVASAGVTKGDERNLARSINDVNAGRAIKARMSRVEGYTLNEVDVEVAEGIVLLSGSVPTERDSQEAERIAWSSPHVKQVGNEIRLNSKPDLVRTTKDTVLHQSIKTRMATNKNVKSRNFNLEVSDGVVYLLGVARTPEELAHAAHIASTTKGTRQVVSYVKVVGDDSFGKANANRVQSVPSVPQTAEAIPYSAPLPYQPHSSSGISAAPPASPSVGSSPQVGDVVAPDAIESGEPYFRDPVTGKRIILPEGVTPIPYAPDAGPGSLGAGGQPLPPGVKPSKILGARYNTGQ